MDFSLSIDSFLVVEHAISKPILVQGGHHQNLNEVMSPKSSESNSLYVKMAENVLGSSPTTVVAAKFVR